jgi:hypothetical protein
LKGRALNSRETKADNFRQMRARREHKAPEAAKLRMAAADAP